MTRLFRRLAPDADVSRRDIQFGLVWVVRNGLASQAMETLTIGAFLVAYALQLGASNVHIGILAAVPHLVQFAQLFGVYLLERYRARRLLCVVAGAISRPMLLVMAAAAFVPSSGAALSMLIAAFVVRYTLGAIVGTSWNAWLRDLVPEARRGRFFAKRLMLMTLIGMGLSLAAAGFVDVWTYYWPDEKAYAYSILLGLAFVFGAASVYCMTRMPDPNMSGPPTDLGFKELLSRPFADLNFRSLMLFLGSWNFAVNLAAPFFTVYMLTRLGLDLTTVTVLTVLSQLANVLVLREWGAIADRFSNKSVLSVCGPLFILCIFAWTFTTFPERHLLTIPLLVAIHVLTGVATAGVTLGSTNIGLKLAPAGSAAAYLASSSLVNAIAAGIAPIIGGLSADFFLKRDLTLILHWTSPDSDVVLPALSLQHWDFFFVFATLVGAYSIHRLALVREVGEVSERVVLGELLVDAKRTVRNLSTVAGLRSLTEFPFDALRRSIRRRRRRQERRQRKTDAKSASRSTPKSDPTAPPES